MLRSSEDLLGDVADAFARIEDPAERVRLAFKLFDSEGVALVNCSAAAAARWRRCASAPVTSASCWRSTWCAMPSGATAMRSPCSASDSLDDPDLDHPADHVLIRNDRAGADIATLDVEPRYGIAGIQKLFSGDGAAGIGLENRSKLLVREHGVAGQAEFTHEHTGAGRGPLLALRWRPRQRGQLELRWLLRRELRQLRARLPRP
jgi:hypothetical protein